MLRLDSVIIQALTPALEAEYREALVNETVLAVEPIASLSQPSSAQAEEEQSLNFEHKSEKHGTAPVPLTICGHNINAVVTVQDSRPNKDTPIETKLSKSCGEMCVQIFLELRPSY